MGNERSCKSAQHLTKEQYGSISTRALVRFAEFLEFVVTVPIDEDIPFLAPALEEFLITKFSKIQVKLLCCWTGNYNKNKLCSS